MESDRTAGLELPAWLPHPLCYDEFGGNWEDFLNAVYSVFVRDFKLSKPTFGILPVCIDRSIENGKEVIFWHIIQKDDIAEGGRVPDIRRCEHICWPRPIIEHSKDAVVSMWEDKRKKRTGGRETRILIWLETFDYLIVLAKRSSFALLVTAFCVEHDAYREKLRRERDTFFTKGIQDEFK